MNQGSLCTGIYGLDAAAESVFGTTTVWVAETDEHATAVLDRRVEAPNLGDITNADTMRAAAPVDVLTAGFPCQDISGAGKGAGIHGDRSALWFTVLEWVKHLQPEWVCIENVADLRTRGLDVVLAGLAEAGYGGAWCYYRAGYYSHNPSGFAHVGGCHQRPRIFILAQAGGPWFQRRTPPATNGLPNVPDVGKLIPTVAAWDGARGPDLARAHRPNSGGMDLVTTVERLLPTVMADRSGSNRGGGNGNDWGEYRPSLDKIDMLLPTATRQDGHSSRNATANRQPGHGAHTGTTLSDVAWADVWGDYSPAVARWAAVCGVLPPDPTTLTGRLSGRFPEWMMGYPAGWVTDVVERRTEQLKLVGNSVMAVQAAAAFGWLRSSMADQPSLF